MIFVVICFIVQSDLLAVELHCLKTFPAGTIALSIVCPIQNEAETWSIITFISRRFGNENICIPVDPGQS